MNKNPNCDELVDFVEFGEVFYIEEVESINKSNRFSWSTHSLIKVHIASRVIESFIPIVSMCAVHSVISDIVLQNLPKTATRGNKK